ncbi:hypothetical protein RJI07_07840 [Mycoplasmatota bacterium WC30]
MIQDNEKLNVLYNTILMTFDKYSDDNPRDFIDDVNLLYAVLYNERYQFGFVSFWKYFMKKYDIDTKNNKLFENDSEFASTIYYKCVTPLNLKLDIVGSSIKVKKNEVLSFLNRVINWAKRSVRDITISTIAISVIFFSVMLSFYFYNSDEIWYSNLFIGLATGVFAGVVIKWINSMIRGHMKFLEAQKILANRYSDYFFKTANSQYEEYKAAIETKNKKDILLRFVDINNLLNDYLRRIKQFKRIKTIEEYYKLKDFEKELFEYSSEIVRRLFPIDISKLTKKELDKLTLYLVNLQDLLDDYLMKYKEILQKIDFDIQRISTKLIN